MFKMVKFVYYLNINHYMRYRIPPESGDPSSLLQEFQDIRINIHCCRYWWLKNWKHTRLSYPFWRLYYNFNEGAYALFREKISLGPDKILLIPPFTPFSTDIEDNDDSRDYGLEGGWIKSSIIEQENMQKGYILHFFLHFNIGYPLDEVSQDIYSFTPENDELDIIKEIADRLKSGATSFNLTETILMQKLIISLLVRLPGEVWNTSKSDARIQKVIQYINRNFHHNITNEKMASIAGMAVNSFARLFKIQTGFSPVSYLTKIRIENATNLLYHTNKNIAKIAEESGYSDRYYFSKIFKREMKMSPAAYRKQFYLK